MKKKMNKISIIFLFLLLLLIWGCDTAPSVNPPSPEAVLTGITVEPQNMFIPKGDTQTITSITASYDTAADTPIPPADCSYSSDDPSIATVSANGTITGVNPGSATITVSYTAGGIIQTDTIGVLVSLSVIMTYPVNNLTQDTGYYTIQAALDDAQSNDTIQVAKGTYDESLTFPSGKVIILKSKDGPSSTIIKGENDKYTITCDGCLTGTKLEGFTITHIGGANGSGLYNHKGDLTLTDCIVSYNFSKKFSGAGIYNHDANLSIIGCTISNNFATLDPLLNGGGIFNCLGILSISGNTKIINNIASIEGGGIYNSIDSVLTINGCTISGNRADSGGGICNYLSTLDITESTISDNTAGNLGGGIYSDEGTGKLTVTGSSILENRAMQSGGGIYIAYYPTAADTIGGSSSADTAHFNTFFSNLIEYDLSLGTGKQQHIASASGDIQGNFPNNYYLPF